MAAARGRGRGRRAAGPKVDPYADVTRRITEALERGTVPWRTPWAATGHRNAASGRAYRGVNTLVLQMAALEAGYSDARWLTFKQAKAAGGHVRRGEHGTRVILWRWLERKRSDDDEQPERFPLVRLFTVFNVAQVEADDEAAGLKLAKGGADPFGGAALTPNERADAMIAEYIERQGGPTIHHGAESAYYVPERDEVHVPARGQFSSADAYYATVLHELAHSTGHPTRLGREGYRTAARFGSERYSQEELVAEFAAAFLGNEAGIDPSRVEQSAAYIASWLRVLDDDRRMVVVAAAQAQRAADHMLGRVAEQLAMFSAGEGAA